MDALLALEDGTVYQGSAFGALDVTQVGEVCFNTSMSGYQEILTDPSYRGQIVTMTYPHIGNYGVNAQDDESYQPHVRGFVVRELASRVSNWRAEKSLDQYLKDAGIPGIQGIDTRALTRRLRVEGAMKGILTTSAMSPDDAVDRARSAPDMVGSDYVREVTHKEIFDWDPDDRLSGEFDVLRGTNQGDAKNQFRPLPEADIHIAAIDYGAKYNILRCLRRAGFRVRVYPATTPAETILADRPEGIFLSNGPGDPAALDYCVNTVSELMKSGTPTFGICLGHQILSQACGAKTFKLKFGHRGANQPVQDVETGRVEITSQNHGFAVDPDALNDDVEVSKINLNDRTVEGIRHKKLPAFSVQYHPEASPGPHDSQSLFHQFRELIASK